ncbi:MAG: discoidin domain-containing protein [Planctomycetota bacterium]
MSKLSLLRAFLALPLLCALAPAMPGQRSGAPARFVRVELAGPARILQLAEVWVVVGGQNVAPEGKATQSSTMGESEAARAIDGGTNGDHGAGSVSHTNEGPDPWWEVDLGRSVTVDQVTLFNRTDCCGERLEGFRLVLLDEARNEVWEQSSLPAPKPRFDVAPFGAAIVTPPPSIAEKRAFQPSIDKAIDRGLDFLRATQLVDGSWSQHQGVHFGGQTALSLLTLLKGGAPVDDPAVVAAISFLKTNGTESTYGTGCLLMALEALGDGSIETREWAGALAEQLMSTQGGADAAGKHPGMWTYPLRPNSTVCLSNTQYAILGLRAAQRMGVEVPSRVFRKTLEDLPDYRGDVVRVKGVGPDSRGAPTAGFQYRAEGGHGGTSGSMTTAALAVMHVCRESLGSDLPRRFELEVEELEESAWRWLDLNFAIESNPGRPDAWHYYYLYGLERVGAFFERATVGGQDWYWDGARYLVSKQKGDGDWGDQTNTCFAVLFLKRATASKSGPSKRAANEVHIAEGADAEVRWRGTGRTDGTFWITGFGQALLERLGGEAAVRVQRVEYTVDGEVVASLDGNIDQPWRPADRYAARIDLAARGKGVHVVGIKVHVVDPIMKISTTGYLALEGPALSVDVPAAVDRLPLGTLSHASENLIADARVSSITASSQNNDGQAPGKAIDGLQGSYWLCAKDDATPTLTLELERPVRARRLVLSHANVEARTHNAHDRAKVIEVRINRDQEPLRFELELDDRRKSVLELPAGKQIRRIEIRVIERVPGTRWPGHVGFGEVELLAEPRRPRR